MPSGITARRHSRHHNPVKKAGVTAYETPSIPQWPAAHTVAIHQGCPTTQGQRWSCAAMLRVAIAALMTLPSPCHALLDELRAWMQPHAPAARHQAHRHVVVVLAVSQTGSLRGRIAACCVDRVVSAAGAAMRAGNAEAGSIEVIRPCHLALLEAPPLCLREVAYR